MKKVLWLFGINSLFAVTGLGQAALLDEGFETDGHGIRYTASSNGGFYTDRNVHFQRTDGSNIDNESGDYTGFSGMYFWAAEQTGSGDDNSNTEQTIVFKTFNIAGYTDLTISGLFGAGNEVLPRTGFAYDFNDYIRLSYQIDSGAETDVLCFAYEYHGDTFNEPFGLDADCDGEADNLNGTNRLGKALAEYNADIAGTGDSLTVRIRVDVDFMKEEIAFDDIKVSGTLLSNPEPTNHPTAFTATASSQSQINLSWTDATGTDLPRGYVIYASATNSFSTPIDGIPPVPDADLSDGSAVVRVNHGAGSSYRFSSLTALTTYYFQIWAYSNGGSSIDYLTSTPGSTVSGTTLTVIFKEGFETDGHGSRYTVSSGGGFYTGRHDYFTRTDGSDIRITGRGNEAGSASYTGFSGNWFWAAQNTNDDGGDGNPEQTIVFKTDFYCRVYGYDPFRAFWRRQ